MKKLRISKIMVIGSIVALSLTMLMSNVYGAGIAQPSWQAAEAQRIARAQKMAEIRQARKERKALKRSTRTKEEQDAWRTQQRRREKEKERALLERQELLNAQVSANADEQVAATLMPLPFAEVSIPVPEAVVNTKKEEQTHEQAAAALMPPSFTELPVPRSSPQTILEQDVAVIQELIQKEQMEKQKKESELAAARRHQDIQDMKYMADVAEFKRQEALRQQEEQRKREEIARRAMMVHPVISYPTPVAYAVPVIPLYYQVLPAYVMPPQVSTTPDIRPDAVDAVDVQEQERERLRAEAKARIERSRLQEARKKPVTKVTPVEIGGIAIADTITNPEMRARIAKALCDKLQKEQ